MQQLPLQELDRETLAPQRAGTSPADFQNGEKYGEHS